MTTDDSPGMIVIGGGPVGLAMALLLANEGRPVTVMEAKAEVTFSDQNSYPIGVNPRGREALRRIDPALLDTLADNSEPIEGWRIYAGNRLVAKLPSGSVVSTTRSTLTRILWERAQQHPLVTITTGRRLIGLDIAARQLNFATPTGETVTVNAAESRVIAADGVWSAARRSMAEQVPGFTPEVDDWGVRFRVIYSQPGAKAPGLDPSLHYIFGGKGLYTATLRDEVWCVATTAVKGSDDEALLDATEATSENVAALRSYVAANAPLALPLLTEQDYRDYFSRDSFSGAVVRCPSLHVDEWLVLIGDAAHSVIPPTGEGVNSGLEDCCILTDHLTSASATSFADYDAARLPDVRALGDYAYHLMLNVRSTDAAFRTANVVLRILNAVAAPFGAKAGKVEARLFGPGSDRTPYREILREWLTQRERLFPRIQAAVEGVQRVAGGVRSVSSRVRKGRR